MCLREIMVSVYAIGNKYNVIYCDLTPISFARTTTVIPRPPFDRQPISVVAHRHVTTHLPKACWLKPVAQCSRRYGQLRQQ